MNIRVLPDDPNNRSGNRRWLHAHLGARIRPEHAGGKWRLARRT